MVGLLQFVLAFVLWTFCSYWLHRFAHMNKKHNPLWTLHRPHHLVKYEGKRTKPDWHNFFFWFGSWHQTIDVWVIYTAPAVLCAVLIGGGAYALLIFHYIYEVFLADEVLEHNSNIKGWITKFFAIGDYHMRHHSKFQGNYASIFTFWDKIFGTEIKEKI